jgi:hypothetical protein
MTSLRPAVVALLCLAVSTVACTQTSTPPSATPGTPPRSSTSVATPSRTPTAQSSGVATVQASAIAAPPPAAGQVLLQQSGGGGTGNNCCTVGLSTNAFTSPGAWDLNWHYDCSALGRPGNFSIDVFDSNGGFVSDPPSLLQLGSGGSGTQNYNRPGTFSLTINSSCQWNVSVLTAARPTATPVGTNAGAPPTPSVQGATFAGPSTANTTATASASNARQNGLQALQPSIPTPRPAVPPALGAFAAPAVGQQLQATAAAGGSTSSSAGSTAPSATATPLRAVTPSR